MLLHERAADLALLLLWFVPRCIVTVWIMIAAEERTPAPTLALDNLPAAFRTRDARIAQQWLGIAAVRESGAGEELAETPLLDHHHAPAFVTWDIRDLIGNLDLSDDILRLFERFVKRIVKLAEQIVLVERAVRNLVQFPLQIRRELHVHNVLEVFLEHIGDDKAELRRAELLLAALDIAALLNRLNDRRIGARTPDPHLLEGLDNRRVIVARRRLREMLLGFQLRECKGIARLELRQQGILFLLCNLRAHIDGGIALEPQLRAVCAQLIVPRRNLRSNRIVDGGGHLTRRKALPDQRIEAQLVAVQIRFDIRRRTHDARRADALMRVLCLLSHHIDIRMRGNIVLAICLAEIAACLIHGEARDTRRIRSHVGDKPRRTMTPKYNALVELLGNHHRAPRGKAKLARGILLQRARRKGRCSLLAALAALDLLNGKVLPCQIVRQRLRLRLTVQ